MELARRDVKGEGDLGSGFEARGGDGRQHGFNDALRRRQIGGEAAFISDGSGEALLLENALQGVEDLGTHAQGLGKRRRADRHDHEFLGIELVVGVRASVHDVHEWHGQGAGEGPAQIAIERKRHAGRGGFRGRERHRERGVRAEARLVVSAVRFDHQLIDHDLTQRVFAAQQIRDLAIHRSHRLQDALAEVSLLVAVAPFHRLARSR